MPGGRQLPISNFQLSTPKGIENGFFTRRIGLWQNEGRQRRPSRVRRQTPLTEAGWNVQRQQLPPRDELGNVVERHLHVEQEPALAENL